MKYILSLFFTAISFHAIAQTYFVGHTSVNFKDAVRTGGFSINGGSTFPTGGTGRNIGTEIYYPATSNGDNTPFATGQFPVVIFGHGFAMSWDAYKTLTDSLVKNGYIVALPRTEGSLLPAPSHLDFGKDLAKVGELMLTANTTSGNFFNTKLNGRQAIGGHSMGGGATFLADAFTNSNVVCYFTFAAAETNPSAVTAAASITKPHLVFSGTYDCVAPPASHQDLIYAALTSNCKTKIELAKAYHCAFADNNFNCGFGEGTCITQGGLTSITQQLLVRRYLNPYLDYYLKGICPAWTKFEDLTDTISVGTVQQTCNNVVPANAAILGDTVFCQGSTTTLSALPSGFSYNWNDNSTADTLHVTNAGLYAVVIGNGVCTLPAVQAYVSAGAVPTTPTIEYSTDTLCAGDTLLLTATSNADYYLWSVPQGWSIIDGDSTQAVTYLTGSVADPINVIAVNSCGATSTEVDNIVIRPSILEIGDLIGDTIVCSGDGAVYTVDSIPGVLYQWTYADNTYPLTSHNSITVIFGLEYDSATIQVVALNECVQSAPALINISIDNIRVNITQSGNTLYATDLPGYTYQWYWGSTELFGATSSSYTFTTGGSYNVTAISPNGCISNDVYYATLTGIYENYGDVQRIYPNPIKRGATLQVPLAAQLKVYNNIGALVYEAQQVQQINTATLAAGIYILVIDGSAVKLIVE